MLSCSSNGHSVKSVHVEHKPKPLSNQHKTTSKCKTLTRPGICMLHYFICGSFHPNGHRRPPSPSGILVAQLNGATCCLKFSFILRADIEHAA